MQYLLIIIFLISISALIIAILAFTNKSHDNYQNDAPDLAPPYPLKKDKDGNMKMYKALDNFDKYTKLNNNSGCIFTLRNSKLNLVGGQPYKSIRIFAIAGSSNTGLLQNSEYLDLISSDKLLVAANIGTAFTTTGGMKWKISPQAPGDPPLLPPPSSAMPGRFFLTGAAVGTQLFAIGGTNELMIASNILYYDGGEQWHAGPMMAKPHYGHTTVKWVQPQWRPGSPSQKLQGQLIFVIGGTTSLWHGHYGGSMVMAYNPSKWRWSARSTATPKPSCGPGLLAGEYPELCQPRQSCAVGMYYRPHWFTNQSWSWGEDSIVVMGGFNTKGAVKSVEVLALSDSSTPSTERSGTNQWKLYKDIFSYASSSNIPPGKKVLNNKCGMQFGCQLTHASMFLVKGPQRVNEYTNLPGDAAIPYIVAISREPPSYQHPFGAYYLYEIPLYDIHKKPWVKGKQICTVTRGSASPSVSTSVPGGKCNSASDLQWTLTYSIAKNITKYFNKEANPIGKYIDKGTPASKASHPGGNWVWCDDYYKLGQHNYIFIGGGTKGGGGGNPEWNTGSTNVCGILDIQINPIQQSVSPGSTSPAPPVQSVFTATYYQGPSMNYPRYGAGGAIMNI